MIVGVPKEIKRDEYRVAMLPVGVTEMRANGHEVVFETGAGTGSGLSDDDYSREGATIVKNAQEVFARSEMIIKVKEPQAPEYAMIRPGQIVFTYFHFAADRELTEAMIKSGALCVAYETLTDSKGGLPLLTPMSEVAGRMSVQEGARFLERPQLGAGSCWGAYPELPRHTLPLLAAVSSVQTPPKSPQASKPMFRFSISIWTDYAISMT